MFHHKVEENYKNNENTIRCKKLLTGKEDLKLRTNLIHMTDTNKKICKIVVDNNRAEDKDNPVRAIITNITHQLLMK